MVKRVVVTGIGAVTPLGQDLAVSWSNMLAGQSGIRRITSFDAANFACQIAGELPAANEPNGTNIEEFCPPKFQRQNDRFIQLGMIASEEAVKDANWFPEDQLSQERTAVVLGSGIGGLGTIYDTSLTLNEKGPRRISPFFIPASLINLLAGQVSIKFNCRGPNLSVVTACSTSAHAIGTALDLIRNDRASVVIAGGAEATINPIGIGGFDAARALSTSYNDNPTKASRPWDKARDGFVMGEGAGVLVLEEYEHAKKRGAKIYAEVLGYGLTGDAYHITAPSGDGARRAMIMALQDAKLSADKIDYINAHGTSTPVGDLSELAAVKDVFKEQAYKLSMSSTKSSIGHLLGAAGSVEAIVSILAIRDQVVPPTLNLDNPDEGCDIDLVPHKAKERSIKYALSNSFGFGGTNCSLILGKVED